MNHRLVPTEDGSLTLQDTETSELFHNRAGAFSEALLNYARPSGALDIAARQRKIAWLDACYGLGYNSLVLLQEIVCAPIAAPLLVEITAVERDQAVLNLVPEIIRSTDQLQLLRDRLADAASLGAFGQPGLRSIHLRSDYPITISLRLLGQELRTALSLLRHEPPRFDLIFHDPFSPKRVPELWTVDLFRHYRSWLGTPHGCVLTYSAAAAVRGGLKQAGFSLWRTFALGGKSGGTLACVCEHLSATQLAEALRPEELMKISSSSGIPYRDPHLSSTRGEILATRLEEQDRVRQLSKRIDPASN